jgi:putative Mg2+ transporter-C (MgtC) family protein
MYSDDLSILLRVLVACVLSGALGWEREAAGKAAGLRTHILVCISAVLFTVAGQFMAVSFAAYGDHVRFDAANLIGAIVTGISFLGAGMIIFRKDSRDISGLTTSAGILTTAVIGMLVALERYFLAVGSTAIVFFVLRSVNTFEKRYLDPNTRNSKAEKTEG